MIEREIDRFDHGKIAGLAAESVSHSLEESVTLIQRQRHRRPGNPAQLLIIERKRTRPLLCHGASPLAILSCISRCFRCQLGSRSNTSRAIIGGGIRKRAYSGFTKWRRSPG